MKRSQASSPAAQDTQSAQASKRQKLSDGDKHQDMDDAGEWTKVEKRKSKKQKKMETKLRFILELYALASRGPS